MQLGVRLEKTTLKGQNEDNTFNLEKQYFNVFPNLSFDYQQNENHNFQLNLSRRIDRPDFYSLNPFKFYMDQYTFYQGNPFLLPNYTNRGELTYNFKSNLSTSIAYSYTENPLIGYTSQNDSAKVILESIKNMTSSQSLEYSLYYQTSITKYWDISFSGTVAKMISKGSIDDALFQRDVLTYFGNLTHSILLAETTKLELSGLYMGPNISGIIAFKPRWMASLAVRTSILKEKLDFTLGAR